MEALVTSKVAAKDIIEWVLGTTSIVNFEQYAWFSTFSDALKSVL